MKKSVLSILIVLLIAGCASPSIDEVVIFDSYKESITGFDEQNSYKPESLEEKIPHLNFFESSNDVLKKHIRKPMGLTLDSEGQFYLLDQDKNRLLQSDASGKLLKIFGHSGNYPGEFKEPKYIAYYDAKVYISDTWNNRIQVIDKNFDIKQIVSSNFYGPKGIAVYKNRLYVADTGNHCIKIFDKDYNLVNTISNYGPKKTKFNDPTGITIDSKGIIYVVDSKNNSIVKINSDGKYIKHWQIKSWKDKTMAKESFLAIKDNLLYLSDPVLNQVRVFDIDGKEYSPAFDNLPGPSGLAIKENVLYAVSHARSKIYSKSINKG
jgi:DNA-binding beta-propeller fold protein YncE